MGHAKAAIDKINVKNLPKHIAIIMDGNGRWQQKAYQELEDIGLELRP